MSAAGLVPRRIARVEVLIIEPPANICLVAIVEIDSAVGDQVVGSQAMVVELRVVGGEVAGGQICAIIDERALAQGNVGLHSGLQFALDLLDGSIDALDIDLAEGN